MKTRTRIYNRIEKNEDFWKSFTDILTTACLIFFFLMIIVIMVTFIRYNEVNQEKINLEKTYNLVDDIAQKRMELYKKLEEKLKPKLGDSVVFDAAEGKIDIKTEVLFETNKSDLLSEGRLIAQNMAEAFFELFTELEAAKKDNPEFIGIECIEIRGHTDNEADGDYNRQLSMDRARNFVNCMVPVNSENEYKFAKYIKASGMSKYEPKKGTIDNQTEEDKRLNRRIEVYIKMNDKDIEKAIKKVIENRLGTVH